MSSGRRRWQVELRPGDEEALATLRDVFGSENESQAGRDLLSLWMRVAQAVRGGQVLMFRRADDPDAIDAFPELTRSLRPENAYDFLVRVPHPWRRQLLIKGRRLAASQLAADMLANDWDIERAAREFDLDRRAVVEALHYVAHNRDLIDSELAEERRRFEHGGHATSPR